MITMLCFDWKQNETRQFLAVLLFTNVDIFLSLPEFDLVLLAIHCATVRRLRPTLVTTRNVRGGCQKALAERLEERPGRGNGHEDNDDPFLHLAPDEQRGQVVWEVASVDVR